MKTQNVRASVKKLKEMKDPDIQKSMAALEEYWDVFFARRMWRLPLYNNLFYHMEEIEHEGEQVWIYTDATWNWLETQIDQLMTYKAQIQTFNWKRIGRVLYKLKQFKKLAKDFASENQMLWELTAQLSQDIEEITKVRAPKPSKALIEAREEEKRERAEAKRRKEEEDRKMRENLQPEDIRKLLE